MTKQATAEPGTDLIPADQVAEILLHGGDVDIIDTADIQQAIVARILQQDELRDVFAQATTTPARDLDGVKIRVQGVEFARSAFSEGPAVYALLDVTRDGSDDREVVSMGGLSLMASFLRAKQLGAFPVDGTLRERRSSSNPENTFWTFELA